MTIISKINYNNHKIFKNIKFDFVLDKVKSNDNFFSLIIGENGAGKSELLKSIVQYFRNEIFDEDSLKEIEVKTASNVRGGKWPQKIIASSFSINDKFPYSRNKGENDYYYYAGIKTTSNSVFIGKYREDLFNSFVVILLDKIKDEMVADCLIKMGLPRFFKFQFRLSQDFRKYLKENNPANITRLDEHLEFIISNSNDETKEYFGISRVEEDAEVFNAILSFAKNFKLGLNTVLTSTVDFNTEETTDESDLILLKSLKILVDAKILSVSDFMRSGEDDLLNLSSGQFHLIKNITTIVSQMKDYSLLLIDEPEISLHPSWQIKYMDMLQTVLSFYKGCHVVVATHSHLLVTTLPIKNSNVIVARNKEESLSFNILNASPSGWSSDMLLYSVFGVLARGNQVFENDIRTITLQLSQWDTSQEKIEEYTNSLYRLEQYTFPENDPLYMFVKNARIRLEAAK